METHWVLGRNLGMDSQNQGWKGLRGTFGWFPIFGANFRIKCLIQSVTKIFSLEPIDLYRGFIGSLNSLKLHPSILHISGICIF